MILFDALLKRYKKMRDFSFLRDAYPGGKSFAFVGFGGHSLQNLYPVIHYNQIPLKYIVCTQPDKAALIGQKYAPVRATTDLGAVLSDPEVCGVFVSAVPSSHFSLAQRVIGCGKALFIEKPPCVSLSQLQSLQKLVQQKLPSVVMAGLQKRYAPATGILKARLRSDAPVSYSLRYCTGAYPEGDEALDLFIHPLDLACFIFGPSSVLSVARAEAKAGKTYFVTLRHSSGVVGQAELSTLYTWTSAQESLRVCSSKGVYFLDGMDSLSFSPRQRSLFGIPLEKVRPTAPETITLYNRSSFTPLLQNNQIFSMGYFSEVKAFADIASGKSSKGNLSPLSSLTNTFELIDAVRRGGAD